MGVAKASGLMGVSERHGWRLLAAYRKEGPAAVAHGNRGRKPMTTTCPRTQQKVMELAEGPYAGLNHTHLTEMLAEREDVHLSRSTVRRVLLAGGLRSPRRRRASRRYSRRERYPQEGMLLQIDGSRHDWLAGPRPISDPGRSRGRRHRYGPLRPVQTAGRCPRVHVDAQGHYRPPRCPPGPIQSTGMASSNAPPKSPRALPSSCGAGATPPSWVEPLKELDIRLILAHTPQAKGRIERVWGTFQDRLVSEMRLAGASTIEQANQVLWNFLPRFNQRFGVTPSQPSSAYLQLPPGVSLNATLCFKYIRTVANDNTVRFNGATIQLLADDHRASYARAKVEVQERLDGSIVVAYRGRTLAAEPAATEPVTLWALDGRRGRQQLQRRPPMPYNQDQDRLSKETRPQLPLEEMTTT